MTRMTTLKSPEEIAKEIIVASRKEVRVKGDFFTETFDAVHCSKLIAQAIQAERTLPPKEEFNEFFNWYYAKERGPREIYDFFTARITPIGNNKPKTEPIVPIGNTPSMEDTKRAAEEQGWVNWDDGESFACNEGDAFLAGAQWLTDHMKGQDLLTSTSSSRSTPNARSERPEVSVEEILHFLDEHTAEWAGVAGNALLWNKVKEYRAALEKK